MGRHLLTRKLATNFLFHLGHVFVQHVFVPARDFFFLYGAPVMPTELLHRGWRCPVGLERSEEPMLGTILIILLILLLVGALPTWPYSTGWGYYPGGGIGLILIIVLVLVLVGRI